MVDNHTTMRRIQLKGFILISAVLLIMSCISLNGNDDKKIYPVEVRKTPEITKRIEDVAQAYFNVIDIDRMKVYSLGKYYITQSILCGPSGRASNYHHYLLMDGTCSKQIYFMSLSSEIKNIWIEGDSLFVNLLDFINEAYDNDEYPNCDKCKYVLRHMRLLTSSFVLETVTENVVYLRWGDLEKY